MINYFCLDDISPILLPNETSVLSKQASTIEKLELPNEVEVHQSIPKAVQTRTIEKSPLNDETETDYSLFKIDQAQTVQKLTSVNETEVDYSISKTVQAQTVQKPLLTDEAEVNYQIPKTEPPPVAKPINKTRISEFASLLSSAVHLTQPPAIKKTETPKSIPTINRPPPSPSRSEDQSFSSILSESSDRDERESYHTVRSNNNSEREPIKKHIDARYNEKNDDRNSIKINTSNIKALFEQKISDTNKALAQSSEHLLHLSEARQQHRKVPVSYNSSKRNTSISPQHITFVTNRRQSYQDPSNMNKYSDHTVGTKDVIIEDKQVCKMRNSKKNTYGSIEYVSMKFP